MKIVVKISQKLEIKKNNVFFFLLLILTSLFCLGFGINYILFSDYYNKLSCQRFRHGEIECQLISKSLLNSKTFSIKSLKKAVREKTVINYLLNLNPIGSYLCLHFLITKLKAKK